MQPQPDTIQLINNLLAQSLSGRKKSFADYAKALQQFGAVQSDERQGNRLYGTGFNPLDQFDIAETTHSCLIGNLLNPRYPHGQDDLFLVHFLKLLGVRTPDQGPWAVTIEGARIDLLLKRQNPHSVIVIENKSNYAADRESQLYRYWYQQIYLPNQGRKDLDFRKVDTYERAEINDRYKILYLAPDAQKKPAEHSLRRPGHLADVSFPEQMPIACTHLTYDDFIVKWLKACLQDLPSTNLRLREYVRMYIDYWK